MKYPPAHEGLRRSTLVGESADWYVDQKHARANETTKMYYIGAFLLVLLFTIAVIVCYVLVWVLDCKVQIEGEITLRGVQHNCTTVQRCLVCN